MAETRRYFWLRLKDDFFQSKRIKKLRRMAGGDTYVIIYLKMQLKSIKTGGMLRFTGIEGDFAEELALDLDEETDDVRMTLAFLQSTGLIETSDDVNFFLPFAAENTGSELAAAQRMREYRKREKERESVTSLRERYAAVTPALRERYGEIEKELESEIESEKEINIDSTTVASIDTTSVDAEGPTPPTRGDVRNLIETWNALSIAPVEIDVDPQSDRAKAIREAVNTYGMDKLLEAVNRCRGNAFLSGGGNRGWKASFDWLLKNAGRILEGAFDEYKPAPALPEQKPNKAALQKSSAASPGELEMQMVRRLQEDLEESDGMA